MRIGCDIVKIERFVNLSESFFMKYYTEDELTYAANSPKPFETLAGMFSAKEAFAKALGEGFFHGLKPKDIEVVHDEMGAPSYKLGTDAYLMLRATEKAHLSISHTSSDAMAFCVISNE